MLSTVEDVIGNITCMISTEFGQVNSSEMIESFHAPNSKDSSILENIVEESDPTDSSVSASCYNTRGTL